MQQPSGGHKDATALDRKVFKRPNRGIAPSSSVWRRKQIARQRTYQRATHDDPTARHLTHPFVHLVLMSRELLCTPDAMSPTVRHDVLSGLSLAFRLHCLAKTKGGDRVMSNVNARDQNLNEDSRQQLIDQLNGDLAREYQAIIAYVIYSQTLKGAQYMAIAKELETHAAQELDHAIRIARQIDYLGGTPTAEPKPVRVSDDAREMLQFDLENEIQTIRSYRDRVRQCEALGEFAMAEEIREILRDEQEHQIDLATALGIGPLERQPTKRDKEKVLTHD
jgi:bacterioferritin